MINRIIKKGSFNYIVTLAIFLISVSFLTRGSVIDQRNEIKLGPKINIKTSDTQITPNRAKEIALAHARVSEADANYKKIKLENKNGKSV